MKNIFGVVAFVLLICGSCYSQNYFIDGDFEIGKSFVNTNSTCENLSCGTSLDYQTYFNTCPGGYSCVRSKMQFWTDRNSTSVAHDNFGGCSLCAPHSPDWGYNGHFDVSTSSLGGAVTTPTLAKHGNGYIGARYFELFQQQINPGITRRNSYIMSAYIKQVSIGQQSSHAIWFILSSDQISYGDGACEETMSTNFKTITNFNPTVVINNNFNYGDEYVRQTIAQTDHTYDNWKLVQQSFYTGNQNPNLSWFTCNVTGDLYNTEEYPVPYFAFDDFYISEAACFCPRVEIVDNKTLTAPHLIRAQEELIVGDNVIISNAGSGKVILRASNSITINPGFQAQYGSTFETQYLGCYEDQGEINASTVTAFTPNCDDLNDHFAFTSQNATSYQLTWAERWGTNSTNLSGPVNGLVTHINPPLSGPGSSVYIYHLTVYGCNGVSYSVSGNCTVLDATNGCFNSFKTNEYNNELAKTVDTTLLSVENLNVFPNPSCSTVSIEINNFRGYGKLSITTIDGQTIREFGIFKPVEEFNISDLSDGVYFINYTSENNRITKKITKICSAHH